MDKVCPGILSHQSDAIRMTLDLASHLADTDRLDMPVPSLEGPGPTRGCIHLARCISEIHAEGMLILIARDRRQDLGLVIAPISVICIPQNLCRSVSKTAAYGGSDLRPQRRPSRSSEQHAKRY
jgi:hypothetical protein